MTLTGRDLLGTPPPLPCATWPELRASLEMHRGPFLWRGLGDVTYRLKSSLQRTFCAAKIAPERWRAVEALALACFRHQVNEASIARPFDDDTLGWYAWMQHYGASTRLTDWTADPFVALWFAYRRDRPVNRALFRLNWRFCVSVYGTRYPFGKPADMTDEEFLRARIREGVERLQEATDGGIRWPLVLTTPALTTRMANQRGAFVADGTLETPLEYLLTRKGLQALKEDAKRIDVRGRWQGGILDNLGHLADPGDFIVKVELPLAWRDCVLAYLAARGITKGYLFPMDDKPGRTALETAASEVQSWVLGGAL